VLRRPSYTYQPPSTVIDCPAMFEELVETAKDLTGARFSGRRRSTAY